MKGMQMLKSALVILFLLSGLIGCASTQPTTPVAEIPQADMSQQEDVKVADDSNVADDGSNMMQQEVIPSHDQMAGLKMIHFDFDQFTLSAESRAILADNAKYLSANSDVQVVIEGHCDERGSDEYNLALGESRALAAKSYLVSLGISSNRLSVISYGEEKPMSPGNSETDMALNRRAEFKALH